MREITENKEYPGYLLKCKESLKLDSGKSISNFQIAYQTYGKLNEQKDNAILICHALTGDQFPAEESPITKKNGWWDLMVGTGIALEKEALLGGNATHRVEHVTKKIDVINVSKNDLADKRRYLEAKLIDLGEDG